MAKHGLPYTPRGSSKRPGARKKRAIAESRVNHPPQIYVLLEGRASWKASYARAHLRNRKGYVYLSWRDGERVRELYLGKAPRKYPTVELRARRRQAPAGELLQELSRRVKTSR